ncbi:unnamed protein product [Ectocarpus sp. 12 AP-2014]
MFVPSSLPSISAGRTERGDAVRYTLHINSTAIAVLQAKADEQRARPRKRLPFYETRVKGAIRHGAADTHRKISGAAHSEEVHSTTSSCWTTMYIQPQTNPARSTHTMYQQAARIEPITPPVGCKHTPLPLPSNSDK